MKNGNNAIHYALPFIFYAIQLTIINIILSIRYEVLRRHILVMRFDEDVKVNIKKILISSLINKNDLK